MSTTTLELLERHVASIRAGSEKCGPGRPQSFSTAAVAGDCIPQGDLYFVIVDAVPAEYAEITDPTDMDRQLVPGNTQGARHCLESLDGVRLFRPASWPEVEFGGPCLVPTSRDAVTLHPTHGPVTVPVGLIALCVYQRSLDEIERRERRARD